MSADLAEAGYGDGDDGPNAALLRFIFLLSRRAARRGAGVGPVMDDLVQEALQEWAKEYESNG